MTLNEGDRSRSSTMSAFDAFGQKVDLTQRIREVLQVQKREVLCRHAGAVAE